MDATDWSIEQVQAIPLVCHREALDKALKNLIQEGVPYDIEFRILRLSGQRHPGHSLGRRV